MVKKIVLKISNYCGHLWSEGIRGGIENVLTRSNISQLICCVPSDFDLPVGCNSRI